MEMTDAPLKPPHDTRLAQPDMTKAEIQQWIEACNHEPARRVLRRYSVIFGQWEAECADNNRLRSELEGERESRVRLDTALRQKDAAMGVLFDRLAKAGVDCGDLIS